MKIELRADNSVHIEGYVNAVERDSNIINVPSVGRCVEQIRAGGVRQGARFGSGCRYTRKPRHREKARKHITGKSHALRGQYRSACERGYHRCGYRRESKARRASRLVVRIRMHRQRDRTACGKCSAPYRKGAFAVRGIADRRCVQALLQRHTC